MNSEDADIIELVSDDTMPLSESEHPVVEPVVTSSRKCFVFERVDSEPTTSATNENSTASKDKTEQQCRPALTADEILQELECRLQNVTDELIYLNDLSALYHQTRKEETKAGKSYERLEKSRQWKKKPEQATAAASEAASGKPEKRRRTEDNKPPLLHLEEISRLPEKESAPEEHKTGSPTN